MFSCNLRCLLIFLHGRSRTYRVASLRAAPVGRISYNLYFGCKHVRYVTCDFNKRIYFIKKVQCLYHKRLRLVEMPTSIPHQYHSLPVTRICVKWIVVDCLKSPRVAITRDHSLNLSIPKLKSNTHKSFFA